MYKSQHMANEQKLFEHHTITVDPGQTLLLENVATVRRTTPSPPASKVIVDGKPGVVVSVMLRPEYRIDQWAMEAQAMTDRWRMAFSMIFSMR